MYGWDRLVLFRHLLAQGVSKTAIAQQLGVHRTTLYSWLRQEDGDTVLDLDVVPGAGPPKRQRKRSVPRSTKLAPYKAIIEERIQHYPRLSAVRLFEEIRAAGYTGGKTRVCEFVHTVRPLVPPEPVVRFETEPGLQAQADFARIRLPWGVRYALVVVLGYSRLLWVRFYPRQDMATLFAGLEEAFRHFGGVPRDVLFDQMRAVITRDFRLEGGTLVENAEFTRFAAHWGFTPRACRPYRAKTKGKVERPIRYLRENFLYGREFIGDADLNGQCEQWLLRVANVRLHQTIQARPLDRFTNEEQHTLQPLPSSSYLSLVLRTGTRRTQSGMTPTPIQVEVERRSLHTYAQLAATIAARPRQQSTRHAAGGAR